MAEVEVDLSHRHPYPMVLTNQFLNLAFFLHRFDVAMVGIQFRLTRGILNNLRYCNRIGALRRTYTVEILQNRRLWPFYDVSESIHHKFLKLFRYLQIVSQRQLSKRPLGFSDQYSQSK